MWSLPRHDQSRRPGLFPMPQRPQYREGMEDQLGAPGLVVNAIVPWNTRHMAAALEGLRPAGEPVSEEDVGRLTPLPHEDVHMPGRYDFTLPEESAQGQLRRLRDPNTLEAYLEQIES